MWYSLVPPNKNFTSPKGPDVMKTLPNNYKTLVKQIDKNDKKRVASYAVKVAAARTKAEENLIAAQKAVAKAEAVMQLQKKAMKKFKKTGNVKYLAAFGV